jgi:hypothetical protein
MADQNMPNDASRKSKAEGDRWTDSERNADMATDDASSGITNRSIEEERQNQESLPRRGESRPGAHAGNGDRDFSASKEDR